MRPLAGKIGSSARLLVYHFGSEDGLIAAVMDEVRAGRRNRSPDSARPIPPDGAGRGVMRTFWAWIIHPANVRYMRLLFEVAGSGAPEAPTCTRATSRDLVELARADRERPAAVQVEPRVTATLCAAVIDGLLLEYLSTRDRRRTTQALELFIHMMQDRTRKA